MAVVSCYNISVLLILVLQWRLFHVIILCSTHSGASMAVVSCYNISVLLILVLQWRLFHVIISVFYSF